MAKYTDEQGDAMVAELDKLREQAAAHVSAETIQSAVDTATAPLADQVATVTAERDAALTEKDQLAADLKTANDTLEAERAERAAADEAASKAKLGDERVAEIAAIDIYEADYCAKQKDRWAGQSDEDWAAFVEGAKADAAARGIDPKPLPSEASALAGGGDGDGADPKPKATATVDGDDKTAALRAVIGLDAKGIDTRQMAKTR